MEKMIGCLLGVKSHRRANLSSLLPREENQLSLHEGSETLKSLILISTISSSCYKQNSRNATGLDSFLVQRETSKTRTINTAVADDSCDMYLSCYVVRCHQSHVADLVPIQIWDSENRNRGVQARRLRLLPHHFTCTYTHAHITQGISI